MRTALASLVVAATAVTAVQAQTPSASAPVAAQPPAAAPSAAAPPAPSTPPPPAAAPSTPAPPAAAQPAAPPTAAPSTAAPSAAAPAAPAATPPAAEPAAPTLPTSGPGAVLLNIVEKICVPLVRGGNLDQLAPQVQGMRKNRRDGSWTMPLGGASKDYTVTMFPVGVNKDVCRGEVHYAPDDEKAIVSAFNVWSFLHQPELILQANYVKVYGDNVKRVQKSWEHLESTSSTAINFTTMTKPDDTPLSPKYSTAEIFYQERKITP